MNGNYRGLIYSIFSMALIMFAIIFFIKALPFIIVTLAVVYSVFRVRRWYLSKKYNNSTREESTRYNTYTKTYSQNNYSNNNNNEKNSNEQVIDVDFEEVEK